MNNAKDTIELIVAVSAVLGIIWQISQVKASIDKAIDAVKDEAFARHSLLEKKLDIHIEGYINRQEMMNMLTSQLDQKIDHKFSRCYGTIRDMEKYLQKHHNPAFRVREFFDDDSSEL